MKFSQNSIYEMHIVRSYIGSIYENRAQQGAVYVVLYLYTQLVFIFIWIRKSRHLMDGSLKQINKQDIKYYIES